MANQTLVEVIKQVHANSRQTYGVSRIFYVLLKLGYRYSRNRVARLIRQHEIQARRKRSYKVTTQSNHSHPVATNKLNQKFPIT